MLITFCCHYMLLVDSRNKDYPSLLSLSIKLSFSEIERKTFSTLTPFNLNSYFQKLRKGLWKILGHYYFTKCSPVDNIKNGNIAFVNANEYRNKLEITFIWISPLSKIVISYHFQLKVWKVKYIKAYSLINNRIARCFNFKIILYLSNILFRRYVQYSKILDI